jgi:PAS domain S-box-containing protein
MIGEESYRELFDLAADSMFIIDSDGYIKEVNQTGLEQLGYTKAGMLGMHVGHLIAPEFSVTLKNRLAKVQKQGCLIYESAMVHKDGSVLPIEISLRPINWGGLNGFFGIVRNITERKQEQEAMQYSELRYKRTLDVLIEGCMILGFGWTYLYLNDTSARHGLNKRENLIGRTLLDMYPGVENSSVFAYYKRCMEERIPQQFEESYTFADGSTSWYAFSVEPIPEGIFVLSLDITDRKTSLVRLEASLEFSNNLVSTMQDGFSVLDENGISMDANPALCHMTGFTREELTGLSPPFPYWPPEKYEDIQAAFQSTLKGEINSFELMFMRKSGERFPVIVSPSVIKNMDGKIINFTAIVKDVSERKRIELELQRAKEMLYRNVLVREVHHRIKNSLQGVASLLRQQAEESPEAGAALSKAIARVRSIAVVYGLHGEANSQVALCDLVRAICRDLQEVTQASLRLETAPHHIPVLLAETETVPIALIVNELLFNAVKHIDTEKADQAIHIKLQGGEHEMSFIVYNVHGQLPQDFDFSQGRGLGTGLTLAKSLLPSVGAHLSIANVGGGVRAELRLTHPVLLHSDAELSKAP